jgi:hypothetical protein
MTEQVQEQPECKHENLDDDFEFSQLEYCPKGHEGEPVLDGTVFCTDCGKVIYEVHRGHEGCKYGRF